MVVILQLSLHGVSVVYIIRYDQYSTDGISSLTLEGEVQPDEFSVAPVVMESC